MYNKSAVNQNLWKAFETLLGRKSMASGCISGKITRMRSNELSVPVEKNNKKEECRKKIEMNAEINGI